MATAKGFDPSEREAVQRKAVITFDKDHELHGAEVEVSLIASLDLAFDLLTLEGGGMPGEKVLTEYRPLVRRFADECLLSWNITKKGEPVAADADGLVSQDSAFVRLLLSAWVGEVVTPSAPLVETSTAGSTSAAA